MTAIIKDMGAVPAIQLGHTGRKGSEKKPWDGKRRFRRNTPTGGRCAARPRFRMAAATPTPCTN